MTCFCTELGRRPRHTNSRRKPSENGTSGPSHLVHAGLPMNPPPGSTTPPAEKAQGCAGIIPTTPPPQSARATWSSRPRGPGPRPCRDNPEVGISPVIPTSGLVDDFGLHRLSAQQSSDLYEL